MPQLRPQSPPQKPLLFIPGAAVLPDGRPSPALLRRTDAAVRFSRQFDNTLFLASGGAANGLPAEAALIRARLLQSGVADQNILMEDRSTRTWENVLFSLPLIREYEAMVQGAMVQGAMVYVSTDSYHMARCRILFRIAGIGALPAPVPSGRAEAGVVRWAGSWLREGLALIKDVPLALAARLFLRRQ